MHKARLRQATDLLLVVLVTAVLSNCRKEESPISSEPKRGDTTGYFSIFPSASVPLGWQQAGAIGLYPGKKLYDSIDGAADSFFPYGFQIQYVANYSSEGQQKNIQVEVYDMGTPDNAFGIFSSHDNIMSQHINIGLAAVISDINLDFCQSKYFVRLQAQGFQGGEALSPLKAFGEAIVANIKPPSELPQLVKALPEGWIGGTIFFFHAWQSLNARKYIAEENVLALDDKTEGVLAAYTSEERESEGLTLKLEKDILFLIAYPDREKAQSAKKSYIALLQKHVEDSRAEGQPASDYLQLIGFPQEPMELFQLYKGEGEQKHLTANARVFRNYIFGVWDITDDQKARSLVDSVAKGIMK
jgi:hypothetical protein